MEIESDLNLKLGQGRNLLEEATNDEQKIQPWKIVTFDLKKE